MFHAIVETSQVPGQISRCHLTDSELVRRAQAHDAEAWKTLYQRYLPSVWRYAYALTDDAHYAEDLVAEAMLALLNGIDQIKGQPPRVAAWLRAVVRHKATDRHRHNIQVAGRPSKRVQIRSRESSPSLPLETAEERDLIIEILDDLPERQRMALEWKYVEDLPVQEIAVRMGETDKAVEATLYRGRREFRRKYQLAESPTTPSFSKRDLAEETTDFKLPPK